MSEAKIPKPDVFMWQNEDTGRTGFVDAWEVENGFERWNPRLKIVGRLYLESQFLQARREALEEAAKACDEFKRQTVTEWPDRCAAAIRELSKEKDQ